MLETLPWFPFEVTASPSGRRAAARLGRRAEHAYWLLRRTLEVAPPLRLRVLDRSHWPADADAPQFGVTHVDRSGDLVAGTQSPQAWTQVSAWLATHLDARTLAQLLRVHGRDLRTGGPALDELAEALIAHEIAHLFAERAAVRFPCRWLAEAFANYALVAVLGETDPRGLRRLGSLAQATATLSRHTPSLACFEHEFGAMDVVPSVLAQLALTRGVYQTYAVANVAPLARMFHLFRGAGSQPDADFELGRMLSMHVHPTLAAVPALFPAAPLRAAA